MRAYRPLLERIGLTYPQYLVMLVVWQHDALPVSSIAHRLALPPHALSPVVDRLVDAGVVTREPDADDGRVIRVRLTEAGLRLEADAGRVQADVVCRTRLDDDGLTGLRAQLHDLVRAMRDDPSFANSADPTVTEPTVKNSAVTEPVDTEPSGADRR